MLATAEWAVIELLANREAQPVGYITPEDVELLKSGNVAVVVPNNSCCKLPLYTAPPAPAVQDGLKLVPTVPTPEMIAAAMNCDDVQFNDDETFCVNFGNIYAAMLAAAPEGGNG
ncbi:Uncharacterised protein [Serratia entomophila]|nr:Uncharacterised protein [Serratia entomophila]